MVYEWISQLAEASRCPMGRWHQLPYLTHIEDLSLTQDNSDVIKTVTQRILNTKW